MAAYIFFAATLAISPINVLSSLLLFARSSVMMAARLAAFSPGICGSPSRTASILRGFASCEVQVSYTPPAMNLAIASSCPRYISSSLVQSSNSYCDSECSGSCLGGWILIPGILTIWTSCDSSQVYAGTRCVETLLCLEDVLVAGCERLFFDVVSPSAASIYYFPYFGHRDW